jgi:hypothetical protein
MKSSFYLIKTAKITTRNLRLATQFSTRHALCSLRYAFWFHNSNPSASNLQCTTRNMSS